MSLPRIASSRQGSSGILRSFASLEPIAFVFACAASLAFLTGLYTWNLEVVPPYLNQDEAGMGLAAFLIATTGGDYWGNLLPVYVLCFDVPDLNPSLLSYWAIPFIQLMGFSVGTLRFSVALLGIAGTFLMGVVAWRMTNNRWLGLVGAWILALTPLFFIQSRLFMQILAVTFTIAWFGLVNEYERSGDSRFLLATGLVLGLGFYSYTTTRLLMPMLLALTLMTYLLAGRITWKTAAATVVLFGVMMVPALSFAAQNQELYFQRFQSVSWFKAEQPLLVVVRSFLDHYLAQFNLSDLFLVGDKSLTHSTGQAGVFLKWMLPLMLTGVGFLLALAIRHRAGPALILLGALVVFPVPAALLDDYHHPYWGLYVVGIAGLVSVVGIRFMIGLAQRRAIFGAALALIFVMYLGEGTLFLKDYFSEYPYRAVAQGQFNGNKPLAFRTIMADNPRELYLDKEDPTFPTYARFFQAAYGYDGLMRLVRLSDAAENAGGSLLLTRNPASWGADFRVVASIPELTPTRAYYRVLQKRENGPSR